VLPLAARLVEAGERVLFFSMEEFRSRVEAIGAEFHAYPSYPDFESDLRRYELDLRGIIRFIARGLAWHAELEEHAEFARLEYDYILHDTLLSFGYNLGRRSGKPTVGVEALIAIAEGVKSYLCPKIRLRDLYQLVPGAFDLAGLVRETIHLDRAYGFKPNARTLVYNEDLTLVLTSRMFQPGGDQFDSRFVFIGPSVAERSDASANELRGGEGKGGEKLILVSMGTIFNVQESFYRDCIEALSDFDGRVVIATGRTLDPERLRPWPDRFTVCAQVPQLDLLRRADLFISHAGINSVSESLHFGVPMLMVPRQFEQLNNALRVRELGAGLVIEKRSVTAGQIRRAARRILDDPGFAARARAIGESFRNSGGSRRGVEAIFDYLKRKLTAAAGTPAGSDCRPAPTPSRW
jgi:MGT family glycosyltransferase